MFVNEISKNMYTKFFVPKTNSKNKSTGKNNIEKQKEQRTFWESIQKLKPLVK